MSNSIATAKCPSALSSGNYGMSQNRYTDESKEYMFVKLTDSAYRAIEEYQRNDNTKRFTNDQRPKIQVNGNSGVIYFPTLDSNEGRKFGFSIDDIEGSLECIQQTAQGLDVLGSIPYRMRIHANDDIYDATRTKMAIAEETEKSKCIREIKPNQTDIGRKVKKSVPSSTAYHHLGNNNNNNNNTNYNNNNNSYSGNHSTSSSSSLSNSFSRSKLVSSLSSNSPPTTQHSLNATNERMHSKLGATSSSSRSPNPTLIGGSGTITSGGVGNNRYGGSCGSSNNCSSSSSNIYSQSNVSPTLPSLTSASSLSSTLAGGISNGYASVVQQNSPPESTMTSLVSGGGNSSKQSRLGNSAANGNTNFTRGGGGPVSKAGGSTKGSISTTSGKLPDISRRKIRERLIHLLALRPFKKPELYSRLQNEGLRDRERSLISNILKDIATLSRDNTYNLRRQMWNDVNENWPYYTEQEMQQLKRRKPQNLTPPLSSDAGSSTSGQSPTSTHTGSPPPHGNVSGIGLVGGSLKRASLEYEEPFVSTVQPKKQRISHFKKDAIASTNVPIVGNNSNSNGGSGIRAAGYGTINSNVYTGQRNKHAASASTYSPQGCHNADENSGNSDLSYNVLNNMDDFMSSMEQQQNNSSHMSHSNNASNNGSGSNTRKSNGNGNSKSSSSNPKENRHSINAISISPRNSSNKNSSAQEYEGSGGTKHNLKRAAATCSTRGAPPYGVNFVPESSSNSSGNKSSTRDNNNSSNNNNSRHGSVNYRQQSPNNMQQQHKTSNSVIYSPKMATAISSTKAREELGPTARSSSASSTSKSHSSSRSSAASTTGNKQQQRGARTPLPPKQEQQQQHHQQQQPQHQHYQSQQTHSTSTQSPPQRHNDNLNHQQQQNQTPSQTQTQPPQIGPQITDNVDTGVAETPNYDFSNYTPITSIEQRRQYKTEFERDYDEYRQLLERIEDVRRNFQVLADQLQRAPQGCSDYEHIKQQIVAEYERINNEEELKRDKQRFDFLHAKLAHIKQLVTDYDKTLTSMAAAAAAAAQHQQQYTATTVAMHFATDSAQLVESSNIVLAAANTNSARVSPMVSGGESNHSPPSCYQNLTQQQQQSSNRQDPHQHVTDTLQKKKKHHHVFMQQQHQQQQYLSPNDEPYTSPSEQHGIQQQQYNDHHNHHQHMTTHTGMDAEDDALRHPPYNNNNISNNNADSDDPSDSNSNDDDSNDDDSNNDDGSDSNSNDAEDDDGDADGNDRY